MSSELHGRGMEETETGVTANNPSINATGPNDVVSSSITTGFTARRDSTSSTTSGPKTSKAGIINKFIVAFMASPAEQPPVDEDRAIRATAQPNLTARPAAEHTNATIRGAFSIETPPSPPIPMTPPPVRSTSHAAARPQTPPAAAPLRTPVTAPVPTPAHPTTPASVPTRASAASVSPSNIEMSTLKTEAFQVRDYIKTVINTLRASNDPYKDEIIRKLTPLVEEADRLGRPNTDQLPQFNTLFNALKFKLAGALAQIDNAEIRSKPTVYSDLGTIITLLQRPKDIFARSSVTDHEIIRLIEQALDVGQPEIAIQIAANLTATHPENPHFFKEVFTKIFDHLVTNNDLERAITLYHWETRNYMNYPDNLLKILIEIVETKCSPKQRENFLRFAANRNTFGHRAAGEKAPMDEYYRALAEIHLEQRNYDLVAKMINQMNEQENTFAKQEIISQCLHQLASNATGTNDLIWPFLQSLNISDKLKISIYNSTIKNKFPGWIDIGIENYWRIPTLIANASRPRGWV